MDFQHDSAQQEQHFYPADPSDFAAHGAAVFARTHVPAEEDGGGEVIQYVVVEAEESSGYGPTTELEFRLGVVKDGRRQQEVRLPRETAEAMLGPAMSYHGIEDPEDWREVVAVAGEKASRPTYA